MFSDVRSRIQRRGPSNEPITEAEVRELQTTVDALQKQLAQIVDDDIAPNNEACGVANDGMELLRSEIDERRRARDELRDALHEAKRELGRIEDACAREREEAEQCRRDIAKLKEDTVKTREKAVNLRAEAEQIAFFQEDVDTETKHRLRADVQNLETEKERDQIRIRQLNNARNALQAELEDLRASRDAHRMVSAERQQELEEARMTLDMYKAHQESLSAHLKELGGDSLFFGVFAGGGVGMSFRSLFGEKLHAEVSNGDCSNAASRRGGRSREAVPAKQFATIPEDDDEARRHRRQPERTKQQVGGIVLGADTAEESPSEFLRKLPTIFKMGSNAGSGGAEGYRAEQREVEFSTDSNSISAISAITMEDEGWLECLSDMEEEPPPEEGAR